MAIASYTVGPGTLTFTLGTPTQDISAQVTKAEIKPQVEKGDNLKVLSGESLAGDRSYSATLDVTLIQDLAKSKIIDWSWSNAGKTATFTYKPSTAAGATITGPVVIDPIQIGGEVGSRATSDFSWDCPSLPTFTPKS
ncbi:hypothetical protein ACOI9H_01690 [Corynebacterium striatum]|uniref:hypothetical protein n=1 Tax=Corynebacterium striatum TaxID=43770 RepID=UPI003B5B7607